MKISGKTAMSFLVGMFALGAQAASFDCAQASSPVEKAICAESRLSGLDEQLATSYKETLANVADVDSLKAGQLAWLKSRNQCRESACLASAYQRRIKELDHYTEKFTGVLISGGGTDNMFLNIRTVNGRTVRAYCNQLCGDWFVVDRNEVSSLTRKFINRPVSVTVARQRNKDRIAGPGNDEVLAFITALAFSGK